MKIVFVTSCRQFTNGGAGKIAYEIPNYFSKTNEVLFIFLGIKTRLIPSKRLSKLEIESKGSGDYAVPTLDRKGFESVFDCLGRFKPEIIHSQDPGPLSFIIQQWAKEKNIPFITTTHFLPTKFNQFGSWERKENNQKKFFKGLLRMFLDGCDAIVAFNNKTKMDIQRFGYKGKVVLIPNGRDLKKFQKGSGKTPNYGIKRLIFVGSISRRKNQEHLLRVKKCLPESYVLDLVGGVLEPEYFEELITMVKNEKLKGINFLGETGYDQIPSLLERADLFISASTLEAQSLAVIEALAAGVPVVGLTNETIDELVDNSSGFNLPKDTSPKMFAQKIEEICELDKNSYLRMSDSARKRVSSFDWEFVTRDTLAAYKDIIEAKIIKREIVKGGNLKKKFSFPDTHFLSTLGRNTLLYFAIIIFFFVGIYFDLIIFWKD